MISRTFKLCLNAGSGSAPYINVNQYDEGETWLFELYSENGERYIPSSGAIVGVKSDGHGIVNTGTVDSEGRVVITETQQMTASAGRAIYELSIDGLTHGTANFIVAAERKPTDDAVMSDSDLSLIQEAIDSAEVIVEVIGDGDPSEVIGEHVDAWLDNHPEATTTVQDGAITAPKINNSLWDKLLVSEEASGAVASFDDGADDVPVSSLKVALEPVQLGSGDPSPSNVRPIIASNGKNLLQVTGTAQTINGVTFTIDNGVITANGTCTANVSYEVGYTDVTGSLLISGSASGADGTYGLRIGHGNASTFVGRQHGTDYAYTASDRVWINIYVFTGVTLNNFKFYPMIRLASITDSSYQPYQGIMVEQTGKNLLNVTSTSQTINGGTFTVADDGTITVNGTFTANTYFYLIGTTGTAQWQTGGKDLIINGCPSGGSTTSYRLICRIDGNTWVNDVGNGGNIPSTATYINNLGIAIQNGTVCNNLVFKPMIRLASDTDDTFEPYQSNTYTSDLGQSVYGGTVDLATGVLTVDKVAVDLGAFKWTAQSDAQGQYFRTGLTPQGRVSLTENICTCYTVVSSANVGDGNIAMSVTGNVMYVRDTRYTDASAFMAGITGQLFVYLLATPQTIQLTPTQVKTLLGYNNISSTGTVDVIYHADTKLYVDKMTAVDNNIIAPTEADFVATRNYTVNDLVIVNDTLYKCTANIASGSAITPNSNVTQTTLGALIKALS